MRNTVITISRQYGSGGGEIGEQLSGNLGIPLYDKQLFMEAACQSGIHRDFFENAEKRGQDRFSYMYGSVTAGHTTLSDRIFLEQSKTIRRLAEESPCIIVGRGGNKILWDLPGALHVFIYAREAYRKRRIVELYGVPEPDADRLIRQLDKKRKSYLLNYTEQVWGDPRNYHLCIDSGYTGIENGVKIIQALYLADESTKM